MIPIYEQTSAEYIKVPISTAVELLTFLAGLENGAYKLSVQQFQQVDDLSTMLKEKVGCRSCPV